MPHLTKDEMIEVFSVLLSMENDLIHFPYTRHAGPFNLRQQNDVVKRLLENIRVLKNKIQDLLTQDALR